MDAPILLIPFVNTKEVQRQAHDFDVDATYPLEFYQKTWDKGDARPISSIMDVISHRLGTEAQFEGFQYTTPVYKHKPRKRQQRIQRIQIHD